MQDATPKKRRSWLRIALIAAGGLIGLCVICGIISALTNPQPAQQTATGTNATSTTIAAVDTSDAPEPSASPEPSPTVEPTQEPTPLPAVGQDVQVGDVRWKILAAEDLGQELKSDNQFIEAKKTSGKFVRVQWEMENLKSDMASFAGVDLVDSKDRTFKPSSDALVGFIDSDQICSLENLNPNVPKTCTRIWEVPADATDLKFKAGDLELFGGDEMLISLGF